jgi:pyruvate formate lyase activating enzyme
MRSGLVFNIQRYSVHDGPGIRTTVFLKGCPLRCAWCHNPEGISPKREILVIETRCIGCGECRRVCAHAAESARTGPLPRMAECELCSACCEACPADARRMVGQEMTVGEVLENVVQDRGFFEDSGGGVTFSGGEPLSQPEFLFELLSTCRSEGVHTAVDTCGMATPEDLLRIARLTDLFLYDLKLVNDSSHARHTGVSNKRILQNLQALGRVHANIWLRVPLIPGVNEHRAALEATARLASKIPGVRQVNVLPFHATGIKKSERLGQAGTAASFLAPSAETVAGAVRIFENAGLQARGGG